MRDGCLYIEAANLRPQRRFHVLAERRGGVSGQSVDSARNALDVAMPIKLNEAHRVQTGLASLRCGEISQLPFGQVVNESIPVARIHLDLIGNNIMSMHIIDKRRELRCVEAPDFA